MPDASYIIFFMLMALLLGVLAYLLLTLARLRRELSQGLADSLEQQHRAMLVDLHGGLAGQGERLGASLADSGERLRAAVSDELRQSRDSLHAMRLSLTQEMNQYREAMLARLNETATGMSATIDQRLEQISGKVNERLEDGFKKTNETFLNVMSRLAVIDEAQKKIESLTGSMMGLQELLGDKRARGAFGEVQLEALVRNALPPNAWAMQVVLSNGARADCVLRLPEPTGAVAVDSKFPLENYHRMYAPETAEGERALAARQFRLDLRRHIDDISSKYIIAGETSDGAVMFLPAEAVFAEIHARHQEVVDYAYTRRVWIVSPTTLMAVLNTARAVLKDVETRRQIHLIKESLARLAVEFGRFNERMRELARHIRQAHEDVEKVQVTSGKIVQRFTQIESADLSPGEGGGPLAMAADHPAEDGR